MIFHCCFRETTILGATMRMKYRQVILLLKRRMYLKSQKEGKDNKMSFNSMGLFLTARIFYAFNMENAKYILRQT